MKKEVVWSISVDPDWGTRGPRNRIMKVYFKRSAPGPRPDPILVLATLGREGVVLAAEMLQVCERFHRDANGWPNCLQLTKEEVFLV